MQVSQGRERLGRRRERVEARYCQLLQSREAEAEYAAYEGGSRGLEAGRENEGLERRRDESNKLVDQVGRGAGLRKVRRFAAAAAVRACDAQMTNIPPVERRQCLQPAREPRDLLVTGKNY